MRAVDCCVSARRFLGRQPGFPRYAAHNITSPREINADARDTRSFGSRKEPAGPPRLPACLPVCLSVSW